MVDINKIIIELMPLIVFAVTWLLNKLFLNLPAKYHGMAVIILVMILSSLGSWIATLILPSTPFWEQFAYNLVAVFIHEAKKQIEKVSSKKQIPSN